MVVAMRRELINYLAAVLPGLADRQIRRLPDLTLCCVGRPAFTQMKGTNHEVRSFGNTCAFSTSRARRGDLAIGETTQPWRSAEMTGNRAARAAGKRLPMTPIVAANNRP